MVSIEAGPNSAVLELPLEDVAIILLQRSNQIVCESLSTSVKIRLSCSYPQDWVTRLKMCFRGKIREALSETIRTGGALSDVYVLCKVIRCHIGTVFRIEKADQGEFVEDYAQTEYCAQAVQCIENARHWLFHGQGITVAEVSVCLSKISQIPPLVEKSPVLSRAVCTRLRNVRNTLTALQQGKQREEEITQREAADIVLLRCFSQLEKDLRVLLGDSISFAQTETHCPGRDKGTANLDLNELLDALKKANGSKALRQKMARNIRVDVGRVANSLQDLRNKIAHGRSYDYSKTKELLEKASALWKVFALDESRLHSAITFLSSLVRYPARSTVKCVPVAINETYPAGRVLRPIDKVFVGRERELQECCTFLAKRSPLQASTNQGPKGGRLLLLEGVPGVGKSALARQIVERLVDTFPTSHWLSALTVGSLTSDFANITSCRFQIALLVFDDVTEKSAVLLDLLLERKSPSHSAILTCPRVSQSIRKLKKYFAADHTIELSTLSTDTSVTLMKERGVILPAQLPPDLHTMLETDLGNLPLAVNIFSRIVKQRQKAEKGKEFKVILFSIAGCFQEAFANYEQSSRSDFFHTRGFVGSVSIAVDQLSMHPSALCLLTTVVMLGLEGVPWVLFETEPSMEVFYSNNEADMCLVSGLEALFGEDDEMRNDARTQLIAVGLVSWVESHRKITMHQLVRHYLQQHMMLPMKSNCVWWALRGRAIAPSIIVPLLEQGAKVFFSYQGSFEFLPLHRPQLNYAYECFKVGHRLSARTEVADRRLLWMIPLLFSAGNEDNYAHFVTEFFTNYFQVEGAPPINMSHKLCMLGLPAHSQKKSFAIWRSLFLLLNNASKKIYPYSMFNFIERSVAPGHWTSPLLLLFPDMHNDPTTTNTSMACTLTHRVYCLLQEAKYIDIVHLLLREEEALIGHRANAYFNMKTTSSSNIDVPHVLCAVLLVGAVCFCLVGCHERARVWCLLLVEKLQRSEARHQRHYLSVAHRVLSYLALMKNDLDDAVVNLMASLDVEVLEFEEKAEKCSSWTSRIVCLLELFLSSGWSMKTVVFLQVYLASSIGTRLEHGFSSRLTAGDQLFITGPWVLYINLLVDEILDSNFYPLLKELCFIHNDVFLANCRQPIDETEVCRSMWRWVNLWKYVVHSFPSLAEDSIPEGFLLNIIASNMLRSLGHRCIHQKRHNEAITCFQLLLERQCHLHKPHVSIASTYSALAYLFTALNRTYSAEEHAAAGDQQLAAIFFATE